MLSVSMFVSMLREVLRPGALAFLKDPADPNFNPFRELVEEPLTRHARRIAMSAAIYGAHAAQHSGSFGLVNPPRGCLGGPKLGGVTLEAL